jgi:F-type H+-transporting ATPase subunit epsilon
MSDVSFEIITLEGLKFQEDVWQVELPTPSGVVGILPHHIPLISIVSPGVIRIWRRKDMAETDIEQIATAGGFVEVDGGRVRLLADSAERAEDIDQLKAQEALERAKEMRSRAHDETSLGEVTGMIQRESARLQVAQLKRRKRR